MKKYGKYFLITPSETKHVLVQPISHTSTNFMASNIMTNCQKNKTRFKSFVRQNIQGTIFDRS